MTTSMHSIGKDARSIARFVRIAVYWRQDNARLRKPA